jgi:hypothetical protein
MAVLPRIITFVWKRVQYHLMDCFPFVSELRHDFVGFFLVRSLLRLPPFSAKVQARNLHFVPQNDLLEFLLDDEEFLLNPMGYVLTILYFYIF